MTDISTLIKRLEEASGPDRELDALIWDVAIPDGRELVAFSDGCFGKRDPLDYVAFDMPPRYTASIDVAITLLPKTQNWSLETEPCGHCAKTWRGPKAEYFIGQTISIIIESESSSGAIAFCIAALRDRAALQKETQ